MDTAEDQIRSYLDADRNLRRQKEISNLEDKLSQYVWVIDAILSYAESHQKSSLYCRHIIMMIKKMAPK